PHVSLGRILIEWNDLDNAEYHLREALRLGELSGLLTGILSSATMMLAEVKQAKGDIPGANQLAEQAIGHAERYDPPPEVIALKTSQAGLWMTQGNIPAATNWLRMFEKVQPSVSLFYPPAIHGVTRARVLWAQRKPSEAVRLLTRLIAEPPDLLTVEA